MQTPFRHSPYGLPLVIGLEGMAVYGVVRGGATLSNVGFALGIVVIGVALAYVNRVAARKLRERIPRS